MNNFTAINRCLGGVFWGIAALVYTLTAAPTASFWDCGEYIATAYKLQVPHPPGAPLFLLIGRLFSFLAGGDVTRVAFWMNMSSALASAGAVMVVFWILSLLGRQVLGKSAQELSKQEAFMVWSASGVGTLALTFCDTFWRNATETETYALSTLVMVLVVWAMLQWEFTADQQKAYRWLPLVAYLLGLSTGLRLFSVLTLPALCLIFYFKKSTRVTLLGAIQAFLVGGLLIGIIYLGIIPGLPTLAFQSELLFVNRLGLPFGSGIVAFLLLLVGSLVRGLVYTMQQQRKKLHVGLLCLTFLLIGYSTHVLELIRAYAHPPINENNPSSVVNFIGYLQREQYGRKPLLYGPDFTASLIGQEKGAPVYRKGLQRYEIKGYKLKNIFDPQAYTLLPRLWSRSASQVRAYRDRLGLKPRQSPTFGDNLRFLVQHQLGRGYFRYFLWNFAGRSSDEQSATWCSPLDAFKKIPQAIAQNPGRSNYLLLPLLLGLLGAAFQVKRHRQSFGVLLALFLMLGVAFLLFWNPPPIEPRARDYFYANAFLIFTLWIGLGALAVLHYFCQQNLKGAIPLGTACCLLVPGLMGGQGWKSHDRSHQYLCVDAAKNLLSSCAPQAILFTGGDNDTFPLWYVQEVEGFRTDVRVVVLSYANTDWYIQQLRRPVYQSALLPLSLPQTQYRQHGPNDFLPYVERPGTQEPLDTAQYLQLIQAAHPTLQIRTATGEYNNSLPAKKMYLTVDRAKVLGQGIIPEPYQHLLVETMEWGLKGQGLEKKELLLLDLLVNNHWERPIYFNATSLNNLNIALKDYVVHEGTALRLLPIKNPTDKPLVNTDAMYHHLMHQCQWQGLDHPQVHCDENQRGFITNYRLMFNTLAKALLREGKSDQAQEVLLHCLQVMPDQAVPYDAANACMVGPLFAAGAPQKALDLARTLGERATTWLEYQVKTDLQLTLAVQRQLATLNEIARALHQAGYQDLGQAYNGVFQEYYRKIQLQ